jgi:hypothetical protein
VEKIPKSIWVLLVLILVAYAASNSVYPFGYLRYKMTVVVETPEGIKTGSAVREVAFNSGPKILPDASCCFAGVSKGEAVVVDLGKRGLLFSLVPSEQVIYDAFPPPDDTEPLSKTGHRYYHLDVAAIHYFLSLKTGKAILSPQQYPDFVRFRDLNDPKTIENVRRIDMNTDEIKKEDPRRPIINFENAFGEGVDIKEVTIEITSDSVTTGIEKYLPWLTHVYGYITGRHVDGPEWYERLDSGNFQRRNR